MLCMRVCARVFVLGSVAMCNLLLDNHYIVNKTGAQTKSRLAAAILMLLESIIQLS